MTMKKPEEEDTPAGGVSHAQQTEDFGADPIQSRHGRINRWLLVVYLILFVWALYYGYTYWGGLGPGLDLTR
jgi:hypothetical protein